MSNLNFGGYVIFDDFRVDINHPLLTGWREGRSESAKANSRKFSKSKSSKSKRLIFFIFWSVLKFESFLACIICL